MLLHDAMQWLHIKHKLIPNNVLEDEEGKKIFSRWKGRTTLKIALRVYLTNTCSITGGE